MLAADAARCRRTGHAAALLAAAAGTSRLDSRYGMGTQSCGSWTAARGRGPAGLDVQWVLGFVSGVGLPAKLTASTLWTEPTLRPSSHGSIITAGRSLSTNWNRRPLLHLLLRTRVRRIRRRGEQARENWDDHQDHERNRN
jgi:hypothetical protein